MKHVWPHWKLDCDERIEWVINSGKFRQNESKWVEHHLNNDNDINDENFYHHIRSGMLQINRREWTKTNEWIRKSL